MSSPHQDSLLPRFAQGEEGHETTTKFPCLVGTVANSRW
ncbi:DUF5431 family protein [Klebsiella pneumoniae]|nr:DUF5431 family protein [Klebsiella pneumoniae]